LRPTG